jgi:hypothetical protein
VAPSTSLCGVDQIKAGGADDNDSFDGAAQRDDKEASQVRRLPSR